MQPLSGNLRPDLVTSLVNMSLVLREMHLCRSSSNAPRLKRHQNVQSGPSMWCFYHFDFEMCFAPQRRALFRHRNFQKCSENGALYILTSKCASRHNGRHFFDIATSKSAPRMVLCTFWLRNVLRATTAGTFSTSQLPKVLREWCFVHFDFEMCFAPQRRALFRHRNFQKCSENGALYILTSKCASRHNGEHFFDIATSKSAPRMVLWQRRALFRHRNFQKCSENDALYILTSKCASRHNGGHFFDIATSKSAPRMVLCTFWLRNVLRATTAGTFSTSQLPKVLREWCFVHFDFEMCFAPQRRALFRHRNFQKCSENGALYILTSKCASRHNGGHFFDIATSKSAPRMVLCTFWLRNVLRATTAGTFSTSQLPKVLREWCFVHFDFEMCFAPQRRALFRHRNFQKCSENGALYILTSKCASRHNGGHFFDIATSKSAPRMVLCTFWLRNVLRATTAGTFSTSQLPKVLREWCFVHFDFEMCFAPQRRALFRHRNFQKCSENGALYILTSKCASRHNGGHFSTSQLPKVLREWCFVHFDFEMCFAPQRRALFRHRNFQKCSENGSLDILTSECASRHNGGHFFDIATSKSAPRMVLWTFWLRNVLRGTTACNFSSLSWPHGSAPAALASLLFDPPELQISLEKLSYLFAHLHSFFLMFLFCIFWNWLDWLFAFLNCIVFWNVCFLEISCASKLTMFGFSFFFLECWTCFR